MTREEAIAFFKDMNECTYGNLEAVEMAIKALEQEQKTGHWDDVPKYKNLAWYCSECEHFTTVKHNYCPKCGARMIEPQESDEK